MHLTRKAISKKIAIPKKGTKYVVRPASHLKEGVPVLIAVRDLLKIVHTTKEAKAILPSLKLNSRPISNIKETIKLFNLFEADKVYRLSILPTNKFFLEEAKDKETRLAKVISKRLVKKGFIQLSLHDGTNIETKDNSIHVGDSLYLDSNNQIKKHLPLEKGKNVFVINGKFVGQTGVIQDIKDNLVIIKLKDNLITKKKENIIVV